MSTSDVWKSRRHALKNFPLRRLVALGKPQWKLLTVATVFLMLGSGMGLLYPQAIGIIIDSALEESGRDIINLAAIAMAVIFLVQGVAIALRYILFTMAGERVLASLRRNLYSNVLEQEVGFFDQRSTGELTNRLASDTTVLQNSVSVNISMALRHLVSALGSIGFLFYTSPTLTGLMLVIVPPVAIGSVVLGRRIRRLSKRVQDALADANKIAEETFAGIRTVRSFSQETNEQDRFGEAIERSYKLARWRATVSGIFIGIVTFAGYGAVALVLWVGGGLVVDGAMSVGDLTSFILYTLIVAFSLGSLGGLWSDFMRATGAAERVFELLDRTPSIPLQDGERLDDVRGAIAFEGVSFAYPGRPDVPVLRDLALTIEPGEVVALVGASGGGKSTIASLIFRLYDPVQGRVTLDGHDLKDLDASWLREQVGVVAQEPTLFSTSIDRNIRYGKPADPDADVEGAARVANAHDFVVEFPEGYQTEVGERGVQLSGGQKQRVAIARAVLKDPAILILDEATSALDAESEFLVKQALERLMKGRTTLIIAHRLSTVRDADRVVVIHDGEIVQVGSHAELMGHEGQYKRLIEKQFVVA